MELYAILRRSGWRSPAELEEAAGRSTKVGNEQMSDDVRWIRSYVLAEGDGTVGTVCIYQATSEDALRKHATLAGHSRRRHRDRPARSRTGGGLIAVGQTGPARSDRRQELADVDGCPYVDVPVEVDDAGDGHADAAMGRRGAK
jgi:hypothetical protein